MQNFINWFINWITAFAHQKASGKHLSEPEQAMDLKKVGMRSTGQALPADPGHGALARCRLAETSVSTSTQFAPLNYMLSFIWAIKRKNRNIGLSTIDSCYRETNLSTKWIWKNTKVEQRGDDKVKLDEMSGVCAKSFTARYMLYVLESTSTSRKHIQLASWCFCFPSRTWGDHVSH